MKIPIYHINAFTDRLFGGNPAAVCILTNWLPDEQLQKIAAENNLPTTSFLVEENDGYSTLWFGPEEEIELCGHGALAAAYVIFNELKPDSHSVNFHSRAGIVTVKRDKEWITMDFPALECQPCETPAALIQGLGVTPLAVYKGVRLVAVLEDEKQLRRLQPDMAHLQSLAGRSIIVTAPGKDVDFVSRNFYPGDPIPEDAVTGSAHCILTSLWAEKLKKSRLHAKQLSQREGELLCELKNNRVFISGKAVQYMQGMITV